MLSAGEDLLKEISRRKFVVNCPQAECVCISDRVSPGRMGSIAHASCLDSVHTDQGSGLLQFNGFPSLKMSSFPNFPVGCIVLALEDCDSATRITTRICCASVRIPTRPINKLPGIGPREQKSPRSFARAIFAYQGLTKPVDTLLRRKIPKSAVETYEKTRLRIFGFLRYGNQRHPYQR